MTTKPLYRKVLAAVLLLAALALITAGSLRSYKVYDADADEFGILTFHRVSDRLIVIDTTFGGLSVKGERLYTTYDRSQARGKKACPT